MADTAYETLKSAVASSQQVYDDAVAAQSDSQNDAELKNWVAILNDPRVKNNPNGWISGGTVGGTFWIGRDASAEHASASAQVDAWQNALKNNGANIADAKAKLDSAIAALTNYENTSPTVAAQIAADANTDLITKYKNYAYIGGGVVVFIIIVIFLYKKFNKKNKTVSA